MVLDGKLIIQEAAELLRGLGERNPATKIGEEVGVLGSEVAMPRMAAITALVLAALALAPANPGADEAALSKARDLAEQLFRSDDVAPLRQALRGS